MSFIVGLRGELNAPVNTLGMQVYGSSVLTQTLLKHDLVAELWLKIFPINFGSGKRLFGEGTISVGFKLNESKVSPSGVIFA